MQFKNFCHNNTQYEFDLNWNLDPSHSNAMIKKVFHPNKMENFALKMVNSLNKKLILALKQEAEILSKLNHKNVIKLYGSCLDDGNSFLILEWMENDLQRLINQKKSRKQVFKVQDIENLMENLLSAFFYLRINRIFHGDLKPSNILLNGKIFKLADLGNSIDFKGKNENVYGNYFIGTPNYWPPELRAAFLRNDAKTIFNVFKVDSFTYALIILYVITLKEPSEIYEMLSNKKESKKLFLQIKTQIGVGIKKILKKMTYFDYERRETPLTICLNYSKEYKNLVKGILFEHTKLIKKTMKKFKILKNYNKDNVFLVEMIKKQKKFLMIIKEELDEEGIFRELSRFSFKFQNIFLIYQYYDIEKVTNNFFSLRLFCEIDDKISLIQEILRRENEGNYFSLQELIKIMLFLTQTVIYYKKDKNFLKIQIDLKNIFKNKSEEKYFILIIDNDKNDENEVFLIGLCLLFLSTLKYIARNEEFEQKNKELFFFNEKNIEFILNTYGEQLVFLLLEMIKFNENKRISLANLLLRLEEIKISI